VGISTNFAIQKFAQILRGLTACRERKSFGVPVASSAPDEEIPALLAPDARSRSTLMLDTD
jgi:hypothetical protein